MSDRPGWGVRKPVGSYMEGKLSFRFPTPFAMPLEKWPTIDVLTLLTVGSGEQLRPGWKHRRVAGCLMGLS
ncbi:hypothetical protein QFZ50_001222 [Arthrobacter agilis]|nr:hypothetical protein [Arthrobacter agilis]